MKPTRYLTMTERQFAGWLLLLTVAIGFILGFVLVLVCKGAGG